MWKLTNRKNTRIIVNGVHARDPRTCVQYQYCTMHIHPANQVGLTLVMYTCIYI